MARLLARSENGTAWAADGLDPIAAAVWERGYVMAERDPFFYRLDELGHEIHRWCYGDAASRYGWDVDYILPIALGGRDHITNMRPLQIAAIVPERSGIVVSPPPRGEAEARSASGGGTDEETRAAE